MPCQHLLLEIKLFLSFRNVVALKNKFRRESKLALYSLYIFLVLLLMPSMFTRLKY